MSIFFCSSSNLFLFVSSVTTSQCSMHVVALLMTSLKLIGLSSSKLLNCKRANCDSFFDAPGWKCMHVQQQRLVLFVLINFGSEKNTRMWHWGGGGERCIDSMNGCGGCCNCCCCFLKFTGRAHHRYESISGNEQMTGTRGGETFHHIKRVESL